MAAKKTSTGKTKSRFSGKAPKKSTGGKKTLTASQRGSVNWGKSSGGWASIPD